MLQISLTPQEILPLSVFSVWTPAKGKPMYELKKTFRNELTNYLGGGSGGPGVGFGGPGGWFF